MIKLTPDIPNDALRWRNDPKIYQWCRQWRPITEREHKEWLEDIHHDDTINMFGIENKGRAVIGVCGFTSIDTHNRNAEFSLYIRPEDQGEGYGKEALTALLDTGFKQYGFVKIWGEVFEGNPAKDMFKKLGFVTEGILKKSYFRNGNWIDSYLIAHFGEGYGTH